MTKKLAILVVLLLVVGSMVWAGSQTWTGTVSDSRCGTKHAVASEKSAACVIRCVKHGAKYVLVSEGKVYQLDAQDKFTDFAGKSVKVTGSLQGDTIAVESVEAAQ
jgi:hypothetical protein